MATLVITPEIEAAAQKLAEATGTTPTEALADALRAKLQLVPARPRRSEASREEVDELIRRLHALPIDRSVADDEILGYDEDGIPEQPYLGR